MTRRCERRRKDPAEKDKGITQEEEGGAREKHVVSSGTERLTKGRHQRAREGWERLSGGWKSEKKEAVARPRAEETMQGCWKNVERKSREVKIGRERERERGGGQTTKRGR